MRSVVHVVLALGLLGCAGAPVQVAGERERVAAPDLLEDPVPIVVRTESYDELPTGLTVALRDERRVLFRCRPSRHCSGAFERPTDEDPLTLEVRFRMRPEQPARVVRRSVPLPSDVEGLELELRFAELIGHGLIWLERAAVLRQRGLAPPLRLEQVEDDPPGRPDHRIHNDSSRTFWPVDDAHFQGRWQRWDRTRWVAIERSRGPVCTMLGPAMSLGPGETVLSRERLGRYRLPNALPVGLVRYVVRVGEVLDPGVTALRAQAAEVLAEPMLVDVYVLASEPFTVRPLFSSRASALASAQFASKVPNN